MSNQRQFYSFMSFKVLFFPDFYSPCSSALGLNEKQCLRLSTLKSTELADWHLDKVIVLKDTFKLQEVNEHPVEGDNRLWGRKCQNNHIWILLICLTFFFLTSTSFALFSSPYSEIKNMILKPRKQLETAQTVSILCLVSGMSATRKTAFSSDHIWTSRYL